MYICGMDNREQIIYTIPEYISSKRTARERIEAIDSLIDKMILSTLNVVDDGAGVDVANYSYDDGQVKISTNYRSVQQVLEGITALERIKMRYINQLNGRTTLLRDVNSFR